MRWAVAKNRFWNVVFNAMRKSQKVGIQALVLETNSSDPIHPWVPLEEVRLDPVWHLQGLFSVFVLHTTFLILKENPIKTELSRGEAQRTNKLEFWSFTMGAKSYSKRNEWVHIGCEVEVPWLQSWTWYRMWGNPENYQPKSVRASWAYSKKSQRDGQAHLYFTCWEAAKSVAKNEKSPFYSSLQA